MKSTSIHLESINARKAGLQLDQAPKFRVKPRMTIDGSALNALAIKPVMAKRVESA